MPIRLLQGHAPPPYSAWAFTRLEAYWKILVAAQNYPSGRDQYVGEEAIAACKRFFPDLPAPYRVLFMGCGDGTEVYRARVECGLDAYGVTLNANNVQYARDVLGLTTVFYHDCVIDNPEDWTGQFDAVFGLQFLEHVPAPLILLLEVERVLKPTGFCYFETPHPVGYTMGDNPHHVCCPTREQAEGWLRKAGFVDVWVEVINAGSDAARHLAIFGRKRAAASRGGAPWCD